jgi:hypothetical protein
MSLKHKVLAAAASLTMVGGVGVAGALTAGTASAATPSCGSTCINLFSDQFGTHKHPNFVLDSYKQGEKTGNPVILFTASNSDPAEDFTVAAEGPAVDFYQAGLITAALALHYGCDAGVDFATCPKGLSTDDPAFEIEYAPYGAPTGNCVGVGSTAVSGTKVSLQPCGASSKTVWLLDTLDGKWTDFGTGYYPLINGSDTNFSQPFVLTYPFGSYPTDKPRPQLYTTNVTGHSNGIFPVLTSVNSNQLWGADTGVLLP